MLCKEIIFLGGGTNHSHRIHSFLVISSLFAVRVLEIEDNDVIVVSRKDIPSAESRDQSTQTGISGVQKQESSTSGVLEQQQTDPSGVAKQLRCTSWVQNQQSGTSSLVQEELKGKMQQSVKRDGSRVQPESKTEKKGDRTVDDHAKHKTEKVETEKEADRDTVQKVPGVEGKKKPEETETGHTLPPGDRNEETALIPSGGGFIYEVFSGSNSDTTSEPSGDFELVESEVEVTSL